jgi:hypothetical protein
MQAFSVSHGPAQGNGRYHDDCGVSQSRGRQRQFVVVPDSSPEPIRPLPPRPGYEVLTVPTARVATLDLDAFRKTAE